MSALHVLSAVFMSFRLIVMAMFHRRCALGEGFLVGTNVFTASVIMSWRYCAAVSRLVSVGC